MGTLKGITAFMPGFVGNDAEKTALAKWLYSITHEGAEIPPTEVAAPPGLPEGKTVFAEYCADCHETEGENPIEPKLNKFKSVDEISDILGKLETLNEDMPPFEGSAEEKKALAQYLYKLRSEK